MSGASNNQSAQGGPPDDPLIGQMIGDRYRVLSVLGDGGMGTVYLAEHVLMEKQVALKVLHPSLAVVSSVMARFQKEAIALARIEHPNVVSATDFGKLKNGSFYLTLEYVSGRNLGEELATRGALPLGEVFSIAIQIARALEAAHSENIVHRDLKPHNVMVTSASSGQTGETEPGPRIKVLDFGLAKLRSRQGEGSQVNAAGAVFGTPHYMAPEQINSADVDGRTDLYALGILIYEMLAGRRPFDSEEVRDILGMQLGSTAAPLPDTIPEALREFVVSLMAKAAEHRPPNASAVIQTLELLRAPPPTLVPAWYARPVRIGRWRLPLWMLALPALTFALPFLIVFSEEEPAVAASQHQDTSPIAAPRKGTPAPPPLDEIPALLAQAEFGEESAMVALLKTPDSTRSIEIWLALARGRMAQNRPVDALELYRFAIHHQAKLKESESIAKQLRLFCNDPKVAQKAVTLAAESLGQRGVDLLFSVWSETKKRTQATAMAERYLNKPSVLKKGSEAVRLALSLRKKHECDATLAMVERAEKSADNRSLRPLWKLRKRSGCGEHQAQDCYPCLRDSKLLKRTIDAVGKRKAPRY